jgi:cell division inhibitor SulA
MWLLDLRTNRCATRGWSNAFVTYTPVLMGGAPDPVVSPHQNREARWRIEQVFAYAAGMTPAVRVLPLRDKEARKRLERVARDAGAVTLAGDRRLVVADPLGGLLPGGSLRRGSVVTVSGVTGTTSVLLPLLAAATATGEWTAVVEPGDTLGGAAVGEAGVALERCAIVRRVRADRWAVVVAALLEGTTLVAAWVPPGVRLGDARRLAARARERGAVLVAMESVPGVRGATWPAEAALRLHVQPGPWRATNGNLFESGHGLLSERDLQVRVEGAGAAREGLVGAPVALAG